MKNLKRYLSVLLAVAMILTAMAPAFAAGFAYETEGAALKDLGIIEGVSETDLGLGLDLNREQGIKLVLGLVGKLDAAEALSDADAKAALAGYGDASAVSAWAVKYVAYAVKNDIVEGVDATTLAPATKLNGKMLATLILRNIGYTVNDNDYSKAASILADKGGLTAAQAAAFNDKNLTRDDMAGMAYGALTAVGADGKTIIATLVAAGIVSAAKAEAYDLISGDAAVASVKATSAKSFKVTFTNPVADTTKVAFTVKRATTTMTMTTTWNVEKTEATLTASSNLPEASYTVAVKNDTADLGTSTVAITAQKIAKIVVNSSKLAIVGTGTKGYATYKVEDQYGNDITSSYLANNIKFQTGVGTAEHKNGIITVTTSGGINLIQFTNVVITGYDTTSGVSVTATLATSTALGTLSDFQFGDASAITLVAGDVTSVFYLPYTALDMSGNETKDYDLVSQGLILNGGTISVSNPSVTAKVVKDPADSKKAAIELKVTSTDNTLIDMPVTITAMTYTGKSSTVNTTLKKANELDSFTLMAPEFNIAVGDKNKTVPFEAYDQAGNKITRFADINGKVDLTGDITLVENVDGSAKVTMSPTQLVDGPAIISAVVKKTGKMSTLTINVQKVAIAETLELDTSVFVTAMENGAVQKIDFGYDKGGLKVLDQYGRTIDMTTDKATNYYKVKVTQASVDVNSRIVVTGPTLGDGATQATLTANSVYGTTDTVTFTLFNDNGDSTVALPGGVANNGVQDGAEKTLDTKSVSLSIIKSSDIKDFTISAVTSPIYAAKNTANSIANPLNARDKEYAANPKVYGKTSSGAKVLLANTPITGAYVNNTNEFEVTAGNAVSAYDAVKVTAGKLLDPTKVEASTTLTVTVKDSTGALRALTTDIKSSTVTPNATDLVADINTEIAGVSVSSDVVTVKIGSLGTTAGTSGIQTSGTTYLAKYAGNGTATGTISAVTFYAKDQYGKKGLPLQYYIINQSGGFSISTDGQLTTPAIANGNYVTISAVTSNGLIKTIKIVFAN